MDEILTPDQWNELQSRIRQQHPELTDKELQYHEALEQDMMAMVAYSIRNIHEVKHGIEGHMGLFPLKYYLRRKKHSHIAHRVN